MKNLTRILAPLAGIALLAGCTTADLSPVIEDPAPTEITAEPEPGYEIIGYGETPTPPQLQHESFENPSGNPVALLSTLGNEIKITAWGSSSCPLLPRVTEAEDTLDLSIHFASTAEPDQACTADHGPLTHSFFITDREGKPLDHITVTFDNTDTILTLKEDPWTPRLYKTPTH